MEVYRMVLVLAEVTNSISCDVTKNRSTSAAGKS